MSLIPLYCSEHSGERCLCKYVEECGDVSVYMDVCVQDTEQRGMGRGERGLSGKNVQKSTECVLKAYN